MHKCFLVICEFTHKLRLRLLRKCEGKKKNVAGAVRVWSSFCESRRRDSRETTQRTRLAGHPVRAQQ